MAMVLLDRWGVHVHPNIKEGATMSALTYALVVVSIAWIALTVIGWIALATLRRRARKREQHLDVQRRELLRSIMESE